MPTPSKPAEVIKAEGKSHRTKAELSQRKKEEQALLTGEKLKESQEVKEDKIAHKEFLRLKKLLESIKKNDAIYEQSINRYCLLVAECARIRESKEQFEKDLDELVNSKEEFGDSVSQYFKMKISIQKNIIALDKQLQSKRKMLLDLEKENAMTVASALRTIPKKPENKNSAVREALLGGD
ncbi:MAG: hypothetical protein K2N51_21025 [Lachnospiraceae bacterium]|nr:hypothetical protein [Lachnospiraceae bacterium]